MARVNNVATKRYNAKIMTASVGEKQKTANSTDKNVWVPAMPAGRQAYAGTTVHVGGNSH